jgi:hypothetical protein
MLLSNPGDVHNNFYSHHYAKKQEEQNISQIWLQTLLLSCWLVIE